MDEEASVWYEIVVAGRPGWILDEATIGLEIAEGAGGRVRLTGPLADQAALIGILTRLQALRFEVLEVHQLL